MLSRGGTRSVPELFAIISRVLDSRSPSGRMNPTRPSNTCGGQIRAILKSPLSHPFGRTRTTMHAATHVQRLDPSPEAGEARRPRFWLEKEENITEDYRLTAEYCLNAIKKAAISRPRIWRERYQLRKIPRRLWRTPGVCTLAIHERYSVRQPTTEGVLQTWKAATWKIVRVEEGLEALAVLPCASRRLVQSARGQA